MYFEKDWLYEEGEKSSKNCFSLEKINAIKSCTQKLYNEKNTKKTQIECNPVLEIQKQFYLNLYSKKATNKPMLTMLNYKPMLAGFCFKSMFRR